MFVLFLLLSCNQVYSAVIFKAEPESEICETEDCLQTAEHILKWLNPKIDPCDDFNEFVCGKWRSLPVEERVNMSIGSRERIENHFIPGLLKNPPAASASPSFEKLRNFLQTCLDEDALDKSGVAPLRSLIEKAGGWPVLDPDWSEENWDFIEMETVLGGVLLNVDSTYVQGEDGNNSYLLLVSENRLIRTYRPNIKILQEGLNNDQVKSYYNRNVEVAVALGADREAAETAMKEALEFEITFIQGLENLNRSYYDHIEEAILKELLDSAPNLNITDLLQKQLPKSYELLPDKKVRADIKNLQVLNNLFTRFPKRTIVDYMMSKAVYPLLKYVIHSPINITTDNDDNINVHLTFDENVKRLDFCTTITSRSSLGPAMASYMAILYKEASKAAADMTQVIKEELAKKVEEIEWFDEKTRSAIAKNVSQVTIDVGFNPLLLETDKLENIYVGHEMDTSNFFDSMIYDQNWKKQKELDKLRLDFNKDTVDWKKWQAMGMAMSAHFNPKDNSIGVSGAMLYLMPLFNAGSPAYVNYGQVGTMIAHELIHALDMNASPEDDDYDYLLKDLPEMEIWGDNKTESIYNEKKQCFIDFYSAINDTKVTNKKINGRLTLRENMADSGGLKLCLRAYRKLAAQLDSPEQKLPQLEQYTAEQLFMISFANAFCEIPNKEFRMQQLKWDPHSPMEFRTMGMAMNSLDFSEIFHCDKNEPMNPPEKCEVWQ